ncbi:hypothetical protein NDI47_04685 [Microcoleus vaginatus GB1-A2]|uniref:hypothetical protein n=1 Tax=Microcoleus vaginatus TaxID=119532 RepID=UPI00168500E5|nr:hypothetical protein [Microcoleus sp. FACHB-61]
MGESVGTHFGLKAASSVRGLALKACEKILISGELLAKIKSQVNYSVLKSRNSVPAPLPALELPGDRQCQESGAICQSG